MVVLYEVDAACPRIPNGWDQVNWTLGEDLPQRLDEEEGKAEAAPGKVPEYPIAAEEALFSSIHKGCFSDLDNSKLRTKVTQLGSGTLSAHTAELATMRQFSKGDIPKVSKIPQMWLGRTPVCPIRKETNPLPTCDEGKHRRLITSNWTTVSTRKPPRRQRLHRRQTNPLRRPSPRLRKNSPNRPAENGHRRPDAKGLYGARSDAARDCHLYETTAYAACI